MAFALVRFRMLLYLVVMVVLVIKRCTINFCTISYQTSFKIYTHLVLKVPGAFYLRHSEAVGVSKNGTMHENNKKRNIYKYFQLAISISKTIFALLSILVVLGSQTRLQLIGKPVVSQINANH